MIESEMDRGVFVDRSEAERNTLGDLLKRYRREVTPLKKGAKAEDYRIARLLLDPLSRIRASGLSAQLLAEFRDRRLQTPKGKSGRTISGTTVNRDLELLSNVINVARREWGVHVENPVAHIRKPKNGRSRTRRLAPDEGERLLAELEPSERSPNGTFSAGDARNPWIRPVVQIALETAMRRSELLAIRWADVSITERFVRLHDTKNGEPRDVPLTSVAAEILGALPRDISGRVFPLSAESVKQSFERAVKRAGLVDFRFHDLRHEATSRLAEVLDNVLELSSVTGHKTVQMLKRYYHPRASDLARKIDARRKETP
jgi:integrase